jgi:excisionase family DNA binding protein
MPNAVGPTAAARILGLSARHVVRLLDNGRLDGFRTPLGRLITLDSVERLAAERQCER